MCSSFLHRFAAPLFDFIYPPTCLTCRLDLSDGWERVCTECWNSFRRVTPGDEAWLEREMRFSHEGIISDFLSCYLFEKEGTFQHVMHLIKYGGMKSLAVRLGRNIGEQIAQHQQLRDADLIIPVPLHRLKQRERGYNQSEYLCRGIRDVTRIPLHPKLILRKRYTQSQTTLHIDERQANVGNAFDVGSKDRAKLKGKSIILVDDVITTGATIQACARELLRHGAREVFAASAALAK